MKGTRYISMLGVVVLGATMASAQERGRRPQGPPPRYNAPALQSQRQAAPPAQRDDSQQQQQQQPPAQQQEQKPFDRFILHGQGPHAGDWLRNHENLPPDQQRKALESDPAYQRLSRDKQQQLLQRLNRFSALPHDQRDRILQRMETLEHLSPEQQQKARAMFRDFRDLPNDRRREMNRAFRDLQEMNADERQRRIDSEEYKKNYSDKERDLLRGMTDLGVNPRGQGNPRD